MCGTAREWMQGCSPAEAVPEPLAVAETVEPIVEVTAITREGALEADECRYDFPGFNWTDSTSGYYALCKLTDDGGIDLRARRPRVVFF